METEIEKKSYPDEQSNNITNVLGVCLGASTITVVHVKQKPNGHVETGYTQEIIKYSVHPHDGDPKHTLLKALDDFDLDSFDRVAATGRKFRKFVNLSSLSEPEAVEYAYAFVKPDDVSCNAVVSAGGETFMIYVLNKRGRISNVLTGNKCASGTGEFFLQQLRRMNVTLEEAAQWSATEKVHYVSGRCSVFCKSDCTHATNKGVPKSRVTAGLCKMMSSKILELLKKVERKDIMITGGTAHNKMMIEYLNQKIPGMIVPEEAPYFEALGAALWSLEHETDPFPGVSGLFKTEATSFDTLPRLRDYKDMVEFKTMETGEVRPGDVCILGLDVGSTTTKAILLRIEDDAMLASIYLRTNGDPVGASRLCYQSILDQVKEKLDPSEISIIGLGVTGSGRQIAGLHALTDGVINEIIAHASAAVYFDPKVDTIFEIGGQDAKYTYITNSVPSDYAMNEACSAGTGSFLEESAHETLGIKMEEIADIALKGENPPNFNDQCAAFITSDIKNAIHEGVEHNDIVAGLVYSICMNYSNRVKGNRPVGEKVFMQGGVCYNKAVPLAMASLVGKPIVVPPEPGLMGSFGVALEIKKRIDLNLIKEKSFDLEALANREVEYGKTFICKGGGKGKCDRRCEIAMIILDGKKFPFGGACNRYYNLLHKIKFDVESLDLVRIRQELIFDKYAGRVAQNRKKRGRIGFNRSFLVNTYFPLYSTFFAELGFEPVLPDSASKEGIDQRNAAFCYPGELSHGFFHTLLNIKDPLDFIFLPHFKAVPTQADNTSSQVCPLVQGETFYLRIAFKKEVDELYKKGTRLLTPLVNLTKGLAEAEAPLVESAVQMGISKKEAKKAFKKALLSQEECMAEFKKIGKRVLSDLEANPEKSAVVMFGRPYNAFVEEAHMGIPHKLASRGILTIPLDFLPFEKEKSKRHMYWGMGQLILKAARFVEKHPQLFGTFITNFSCGPDSFIVGYFRTIMGRKPSLTLELDSHTADAGIETRIEAFLDIVAAYRQLIANDQIEKKESTFIPARTILEDGHINVITSSGESLSMTDPRVKFITPSMGRIGADALGAVFRGLGLHGGAHPPADEAILKLGRANTSCKECLPLILTTGTLLNYIYKVKKEDEVLVYFMPTGAGPCRFGQYHVFMEDLIKRLELPDVTMFSLTSENSYAGLGTKFHKLAWCSIVIGDVIEDIRSVILANAVDVPEAMSIFENEWKLVLDELEKGDVSGIEQQAAVIAERLSRIPMKRPIDKVPVISLVGEIFVRRDGISRQYITERLAEQGFATICSPVAEWIHYSDFLVDKGLIDYDMSTMEKLEFMLKKKIMGQYEKHLKSTLSRSGLLDSKPVDLNAVLANGSPFYSPNLTGEAILTVGSAMSEIVSHSCGVIAIGPFGCMPNRLAEAVLVETMTGKGKLATDPNNKYLKTVLADVDDLPFLAIESDGSSFPQVINAKLESFCLRSERLHKKMQAARN